MSQLTDFYSLEGRDAAGRKLEEIWLWGNDKLEASHDYIQWLFPLDEPSNFNPDAPLVGREERLAFAGSSRLREHARTSMNLFLKFLGLAFVQGKVLPGDNFVDRENVWKFANHNWLRISRAVRSLRLMSLDEEAQAFWECLQKLHADGYGSENTFGFWEKAATEPLQTSLSL